MRTFFNTKTMRERVLLTACMLIAVVWWGSSLLGRSRALQVEWKSSSTVMKKQITTLQSKTQVDARMMKITAQLDPRRTLNASEAFAEIDRLTQGMRGEIGQQRTERTENFAMNNLQVTFRKIGFEPLLKFYKELSLKAPYLGIDKCSISVDRAAPGQINAVFQIYSVEIIRPNAP